MPSKKPASDQFSKLTSSQTALAIIVPTHLQAGIDVVRSENDSQFGKWPAHIAVLYPSIDLSHLPAAIATIKKSIDEKKLGSVMIEIDDVGSVKAGRTSTVFLQLDEESIESLAELRREIASSLGSDDIDRVEYSPRITVGQASTADDALTLLVQQSKSLVGIEWECKSLVVLRKDSSGTMTTVEELPLANLGDRAGDVHGEKKASDLNSSVKRNWSAVYAATVIPEIDLMPATASIAETPSKENEASTKAKKNTSKSNETTSEEVDADSLSSELEKPKIKLRPAHDIIHRIQWDPELNADDYIIGYTERFEGIAELDLVLWKTEQTDEEFVPLHRVLYIRKKGDSGDKVWDRRTRFDSLFGSGIKKVGA